MCDLPPVTRRLIVADESNEFLRDSTMLDSQLWHVLPVCVCCHTYLGMCTLGLIKYPDRRQGVQRPVTSGNSARGVASPFSVVQFLCLARSSIGDATRRKCHFVAARMGSTVAGQRRPMTIRDECWAFSFTAMIGWQWQVPCVPNLSEFVIGDAAGTKSPSQLLAFALIILQPRHSFSSCTSWSSRMTQLKLNVRYYLHPRA